MCSMTARHVSTPPPPVVQPRGLQGVSAESEGSAEEHDGTRRERLVDQAFLFGLIDNGCDSTGIEPVRAEGLSTQPLCEVTGGDPAGTGRMLSAVCSRHDLEE